MKKFLLLLVLLLAVPSFSQDMDATQIKMRMAEIRKTTNWDNPAEAKKANDEIKELSKKLMLSGKNQNPANQSDSLKLEQEKENIDYKLKLFGQINESVKQGENADILLGEPVRDEIAEDYKNDESPTIKNQEYLDEMDLLVIDMSLKTVQRTIDQMEKFKSIKTLIITGSKFGAAVDLQNLLSRAKNYPLENIYIINFKLFVSSIPKQIKQFKNLKLLAVFDNQISSLPSEIGSLFSLETLYVDVNPISSVLSVVGKLKQLKYLGLVKTQISDSEITEIKKLLPNCEVLE